MMVLAIALPALLCAGIALLVRGTLRKASWITWLGYVLIGAGVPVLTGQGAALLVINSGGTAYAALVLAAGLAGGLGWTAGALSARFTMPKSPPED